MEEYLKKLENDFSKIKNGYKDIEGQAYNDFKNNEKEYLYILSKEAYKSKSHQIRMYAVFLFGYLSNDEDILEYMKDEVSKDENWRVQEILAKAFDEFCKNKGYKNSLEIIDDWLNSENPNTRRAVIEGLRIWTSRSYFKENPNEALERIVALKDDRSEYVRKSVGNAIKDISKKYPELVKKEIETWELDNKEIKQVYKLATKFLEKSN